MMRRIFALAALVTSLAAPVRAGVVYSDGHADFGVAFDSGALNLHFHAHAGAVIDGAPLAADAEYAPNEVKTLVSDANKSAAPDDLPFLGVTQGDSIWVLPQVNTPGVPFLGLASEELPSNVWGPVTWKIVGFSGPGNFALWQVGSFGNLVLRWRTNDGLGDSFSRPAGSHDHYNYGFSAPGVYQVTIEASSSSTATGVLKDTDTFTFVVGPVAAVPEPSSIAAALAGLAVTAAVGRSRRRGIDG